MPDFNDFDLRSRLDEEAFNILQTGNSNLVFGGSSEQEAQIFGAQINANDAPRVGAFLGGVALANLKVQQANQQRFERIQSLNQQISERRRDQLAVDKFTETKRGNLIAEGQNERTLINDEKNTDSQITNRATRTGITQQQADTADLNASINVSKQRLAETQASFNNKLASENLSLDKQEFVQQQKEAILAIKDERLQAQTAAEFALEEGVDEDSVDVAIRNGTIVQLVTSNNNKVVRSQLTNRDAQTRRDPGAIPSFTQDGFRNIGAR